MKEVGEVDMEAPEKTLQWNFQNAEFCDVHLNSVIRCRGDCADQFNGQRNELSQSPVELDLISVAGNSDVLQRRVRDCARIEVVGDIPDIRVNHTCFDIKKKGLGIIK